jgi:hypothetical protein
MRKITAMFLFLVLIGGSGIVPFLSTDVHAVNICMTPNARVPAGSAVKCQVCDNTCCPPSSPSCCSSGAPPNAMQVETLADGMEICQYQGLPSGYVITSQGSEDCCPKVGNTPNTWTINVPAHGMRVCYYQGLPLTVGCFECTDHSRVSQCPSPSTTANNSCVLRLSLSSIQAVTPATASVAIGATQQFTATGPCRNSNATRDVTAAVTWSSSNTAVATISNTAGTKGLATAQAAGTTTITATLGALSKSATLSVLPAAQAPLVSLEITPTNPSIAPGATQQFTATGKYRDNTTKNLTSDSNWSSIPTNIATISNTAGTKGLATARATGTAAIGASFGGYTKSTNLNVTSAPATPPPSPVTNPSLRDLRLMITKQYPERFKFDVNYHFDAAKISNASLYKIEIKVIPEGHAFTEPSFAPATTLNYAASQGSQLIQGIQYGSFTGTLTVTAPHGRPAGLGPLHSRLSFIVRVTGVKPPPPGIMTIPVSASKLILLEKDPHKDSAYRPECTGAAGAKGPAGFSFMEPAWPFEQTTLTLDGTTRTATAVGQEVKVDTNPLPGIGERGVRWEQLWHWSTAVNRYVCNIHWWCEGFSNTKPDRGPYTFRYGISTTRIRARVP